MIKFDKDITTVTKKEFEVNDGIYYGKIDDDNCLRFYKFIVNKGQYDSIVVIDDIYEKRIIYAINEVIPGYNFKRIFTSESKQALFIDKSEFDFHFNNVINSFNELSKKI